MREILFRGQTRKRGEKVLAGSGEKLPGVWAYGGIFPQNKGGSYSIIYTYDPIDKKIVYADTVGQYTGLTDKNGVKIYEGDIVQVPFWRSAQSVLTMKGVVEFHKSAFSVLWEHQDYGRDFIGYIRDMEVIGNVHDNPELLREES